MKRRGRRLYNLRDSTRHVHEATIDRKVTPSLTDNYHRNKHKIKKVILRKTGKHEIIHGEHAIHKQTPKYLHRHTDDIDILTPTPQKDAHETERALDKSFGRDAFYTEMGNHPGTHRVKSHARKEAVADYTKKEGKVPHRVIGGKKYATLGHMDKKAKGVMDDMFSGYRFSKDQDTINRIKITKRKKRRIR